MGYCITQRSESFFMKAADLPLALQAIKKLDELEAKEGGGSSGGYGMPTTKHWSWVNDSYLTAQTFEEAMAEWRWEVIMNQTGDVDMIRFTGEKYGDDEYLFNAIAPYVSQGSYIEMEGEDGDIWRWVFADGKCKKDNSLSPFDDED